jgi:hypothetical protein
MSDLLMKKEEIEKLILRCIDVHRPKDGKELFKYCSALNVTYQEFRTCFSHLRQEGKFMVDPAGYLVTVVVPPVVAPPKIEKKIEPISEDRLKEITKEMTINDLKDVLGLTVKHDDSNKMITFFCMLSAYTDSNQFNISYRAPSSTGKSYIALELADLFPAEDVISVGYASPTSFFHLSGIWDKERKSIINDFERKILIFMDQPHDLLLQRLRPFLSHDKKEISMKITDRQEKHGLRTKTVLLKGYASVIFCTGSLKIDEQEATRNFLLSPETTQEKIREAIYLKARKKGNRPAYNDWLEKDEKRKMLKDRIRLIKDAKISEIIIPEPERIVDRFISQTSRLKPRHARDIDRILSIVGCFTLFNLWHRDKDENNNIYAQQQDIDNAFTIWDTIAICQELNIAPYIWRIFEEVIKPAYLELNNTGVTEIGLSRKDFRKKFSEVYGRPIAYWSLKEEILPQLETAGLITQEPNQDNRRELLIYIPPHLYSPNQTTTNMESRGVGVV